MDSKGDIPERDEIRPDMSGPVSTEPGICRVEIVNEILEHGGTAHVYLTGVNRAPEADEVEAEDIHVKSFNSHIFPDVGLIYTLVGDDEFWIFGDSISAVERHYE